MAVAVQCSAVQCSAVMDNGDLMAVAVPRQCSAVQCSAVVRPLVRCTCTKKKKTRQNAVPDDAMQCDTGHCII